jgi:hypothetical protein
MRETVEKKPNSPIQISTELSISPVGGNINPTIASAIDMTKQTKLIKSPIEIFFIFFIT